MLQRAFLSVCSMVSAQSDEVHRPLQQALQHTVTHNGSFHKHMEANKHGGSSPVRSVSEACCSCSVQYKHVGHDQIIGASVGEPHTCRVNAIFCLSMLSTCHSRTARASCRILNMISRISNKSHVRKIATITFTCSVLRRYSRGYNLTMDTSQ